MRIGQADRFALALSALVRCRFREALFEQLEQVSLHRCGESRYELAQLSQEIPGAIATRRTTARSLDNRFDQRSFEDRTADQTGIRRLLYLTEKAEGARHGLINHEAYTGVTTGHPGKCNTESHTFTLPVLRSPLPRPGVRGVRARPGGEHRGRAAVEHPPH